MGYGPELAVDIDPLIEQLASTLKPGERTRVQAWTRRVAVIAPGQTDYRRSS